MSYIASIRHIDLVVRSLATSKPFYLAFLGLIGWQGDHQVIGERGESISYIAGPEGFAHGAIGLRQATSADEVRTYDRHNVGMHHLAINVAGREDVDRVARWLVVNEYPVESGPAEYYGGGYYALYFYDPDGIKLEVVFSPEADTHSEAG